MRCKSDQDGGEETRETAPETEGADTVIFILPFTTQGSLLKVITTGRASIKEEREKERKRKRGRALNRRYPDNIRLYTAH